MASRLRCRRLHELWALVTTGGVTAGDQDMLTDEEVSDGIRLTCLGRRKTKEVELVADLTEWSSPRGRVVELPGPDA